jgi:di/tricarboxylate transporter
MMRREVFLLLLAMCIVLVFGVPVSAQAEIPIDEIISLMTANIVLGALALSIVGALVAVSVRHYTAQNWEVQLQDVWYFALSAGVSVCLALYGFDTGTILAATTGINTPMALVKTGLDKIADKKTAPVTLEKASLTDIRAELTRREG